MHSNKIKLLYFGAFGKHCSDKYRVKGLNDSGLYDVSYYDYRELHKEYQFTFGQALFEIIKSLNPQVILINKGELINSDMIQRWKDSFPNLIVAYWYGDMRDEIPDFVIDKLPVVDTIMINNQDDYWWSEFSRRNANEIAFSHTATDTSVYKTYDIDKEYDIVFFGNNYGNKFPDSMFRTTFIANLAQTEKYKIKIHGKNWGAIKHIVDVQPLVYGEDYAESASSAKIILGFNSFVDKYKYTSNRTWNSMACGFYLTYKFNGIKDFFTKGIHCDWFENYGEMIFKIDYYLKNGIEREKIAQNGRYEIKYNHTYEARAIEMYYIFQQNLKGKICA